jgi:three-Cys-motif partner protein
VGRFPKVVGGLTQTEMFSAQEMGKEPAQASFRFESGRVPEQGLSRPPDQTNAKSKLIASYIAKFQAITKGGLYIDGFAAPQSRDHETAWTARRVLEIRPARLRTFWLCDIEPRGLLQLRRLKEQHHGNPRSRRVFIFDGDFNSTVKGILKNDRLTRRAAIFALLDQRGTECHWATVRALAERAGRTKIELLYFIGTSWVHRILASSTRDQKLEELDNWWGGRGWQELRDLSQTGIVIRMADRFAGELGYRFVKPYPIFLEDGGNKVAFHLLHASDHPEAPKLMDRAFLEAVGEAPEYGIGRQRDLGL